MIKFAGGFVGGGDAELLHLAKQARSFAHVSCGGVVDTAAPKHAPVLEFAVFAFFIRPVLAPFQGHHFLEIHAGVHVPNSDSREETPIFKRKTSWTHNI